MLDEHICCSLACLALSSLLWFHSSITPRSVDGLLLVSNSHCQFFVRISYCVIWKKKNMHIYIYAVCVCFWYIPWAKCLEPTAIRSPKGGVGDLIFLSQNGYCVCVCVRVCVRSSFDCVLHLLETLSMSWKVQIYI